MEQNVKCPVSPGGKIFRHRLVFSSPPPGAPITSWWSKVMKDGFLAVRIFLSWPCPWVRKIIGSCLPSWGSIMQHGSCRLLEGLPLLLITPYSVCDREARGERRSPGIRSGLGITICIHRSTHTHTHTHTHSFLSPQEEVEDTSVVYIRITLVWIHTLIAN